MGSLRVINSSNSKLKNAYFGLQGSIDLSKKEKIFVPYVGIFGKKGKKAPDFNVGFFLKPNANGKFSMYAEAGITNKKASAFLKLSHLIAPKARSQLPNKKLEGEKSIFPKKQIRKGRK